MSEVKYTTTHEWIEVINSEGVVGITERAQQAYGDIVFVELPLVGDELEQEDTFGRIEVADGGTFPVYAPVTGEIIEVNFALEDNPDLINRSPEGDGWICKMTIEGPRELDILMGSDEYEEYEEEDELEDDEYVGETDFYDEEEN